MASATFVPFFEKTTTGDSLPQYQFSQYKAPRVKLTPPQTIRHVGRDELKAKVLSDLRNALTLSLAPEVLQHILNDLAKYRSSDGSSPDPFQPDSELQMTTVSTGQGEKPTVKLQKQGDKVTNIVVECECGQVITMDCIY